MLQKDIPVRKKSSDQKIVYQPHSRIQLKSWATVQQRVFVRLILRTTNLWQRLTQSTHNNKHKYFKWCWSSSLDNLWAWSTPFLYSSDLAIICLTSLQSYHQLNQAGQLWTNTSSSASKATIKWAVALSTLSRAESLHMSKESTEEQPPPKNLSMSSTGRSKTDKLHRALIQFQPHLDSKASVKQELLFKISILPPRILWHPQLRMKLKAKLASRRWC